MADVPGLDDPMVKELSDRYGEVADELEGYYTILLFEEDENKRTEALIAAIALLALLTTFTRQWVTRFTETTITIADQDAIRQLRRVVPGFQPAAELPRRLVDAASSGTLPYLLKSRNLLEFAIRRVFRAAELDQDFPEIADQILSRNPDISRAALEKLIALDLDRKFKDKPISVIGENGKAHEFPLDYYAAMVAHNAKFTAQSLAVIERAREAGHDLVRISPNPSLHGDWCDAYRGKVFSITGATPGFFRLDVTPNGGAPFHPWCRHSLIPFDPTGYSQAQLEELAYVDPRFVLGPGNDFNTMVRAWWASKR